MSADYWQDTTPQTLPNAGPSAAGEHPWHYDPAAYPSLPSRLATILGRSSHATQNRSRCGPSSRKTLPGRQLLLCSLPANRCPCSAWSWTTGPLDHARRLGHGVDRDFLEADVVANITYAAGVKFLLADFPTLFGTAHGAELQVMLMAAGKVAAKLVTDSIHRPCLAPGSGSQDRLGTGLVAHVRGRPLGRGRLPRRK